MNSEKLEKIQENEKPLGESVKLIKTKRQQTEAQKANTEKMRLALLAKHEASRKAKEELEKEKLAKAEARVIKKAEAIKKREKKELKIIESIPDESSDDELEMPIYNSKTEKQKPKPKSKPKRPPTPEEESEEESEEEEEYIEPIKQPKYIQKQTYQQPAPRYIQQRPSINIKYV